MGITFQQLFSSHFKSFSSRFGLSDDMRCAAWRVEHCRTRELGGHINSCPSGHYHQIAYNSCRHRSCPQCGWLPREQWLSGWRERLLACPHHHVVFTLPHELNEIWQFNRSSYANLLFAAASQTLTELLSDPKYSGGRCGILCALHTWQQTLLPHIHLHCLVTAGTLSSLGAWQRAKKSCLLPRKVLMLKFRGKFKSMLLSQVRSGKIHLPPGLTLPDLELSLQHLTEKSWNVKLHDAYAHGEGVVTYMARYLKGGPMSNSRLVAMQEGQVTFRHRLDSRLGGDGKRTVELRLGIDKFFHRWLQHVPPKGFQTVRGYGLYSGNQYSRLDAAREALGSEPREVGQDPAPQTWQEWCESAGMTDAYRCPKCGARLISHDEFQSGRGPPPDAFNFIKIPQEQAA